MRSILLRIPRHTEKNILSIILILIILLGGSLRIFGTKPGYNPFHPDEGKAGYASAWKMFSERTLDPLDYNYPSLIPLIELIFFAFIIIPLKWFIFATVHFSIFTNHLKNLGDLFPEYVMGKGDIPWIFLGRYLTAFFSFITLILTYFTCKLILKSEKIGLFSTLVLAVNFRSVLSSHFDLPDTYNAFFLLLSFLLVSYLLVRPSWKQYLLAGLSIGLSISAKLQFFSIIPFLIVHTYLAVSDRIKVKTVFKKLFSIKLLISILASILIILIVNFQELIHFDKFYSTISYEALKYGLGYKHLSKFMIAYFLGTALSPAVSVCAFLGFLTLLKKNFLPAIIIITLIISFLYFFVYYTYGGYYSRNFTAIIPFFAILSGSFLTWLYERINSLIPHFFSKAIFGLVLVLVLSVSFIDSLINTYFYLKPWNFLIMRNYLKNNLEKNKQIAVHPWNKYILFALPNLDTQKNIKFTDLDQTTKYSLSELQTESDDYALIGLDLLNDNSLWWMKNNKVNFFSKPDKITANTFPFLAANELFQKTLFVTYKPPQAPENNYVFVRIPPPIKLSTENTKVIRNFKFDNPSDLNNWRKVDGFKGKGKNLSYSNEEGYLDKGSLQIKAGSTNYPVVRFISPAFEVKGNFGYLVLAYVKTNNRLLKNNRDGFLRIDFYQNLPEKWDEETESLKTSLSSRYYGEGGWQKLEVASIAPSKVKFATVSFQVSSPEVSNFWLDDLNILESDTRIKENHDLGEFNLRLPNDLLYLNSEGGF